LVQEEEMAKNYIELVKLITSLLLGLEIRK
jgi:hypothetical protein